MKCIVKTTAAVIVLTLVSMCSPTANAAFITSTGGFTQPTTVIDFSQFNGSFQFTNGPIQVGGLVSEDVVYTSTSSSSVIGNGVYGLGSNGSWNSGRVGYVGNNSGNPNVAIDFTFNSGSIGEVGGFVNYAPNTGAFFIEAIGAGNVVLESFNVTSLAPISTPGQTNAGAFRGIVRAQNDIVALRIRGGFDVLDNLTFSRFDPVPEPASLCLWGLAAVGAAVYTRRRKRQQA